jgi:hypothetical protein
MQNLTCPGRPRLLRRLGFGGFAFFFAKGMLWLALPLLGRLFLS